MSGKILRTAQSKYYRKFIQTLKLVSIRGSGGNLKNRDQTSSSKTAKTKKKKKNEKIKKRPRKKSASLKRRKLLIELVSEKDTKESLQKADVDQGQFPQQPAVSQQFSLQTFFPQISISPSSVMGSSNNNINNGYRGRPNWSPFHQNYYPFVRNTVACHRRRSHLDDIYLPNYEDEDLEERNGFNQERFRYRRPYWYSNNPPQRSDHRNSSNRTLSFVNRSKEPNLNDNSESKTNDLNLKDNATSSTSATSDCSAKNCDKKKCETVKVTEVNSNLLTNELQSESKTSISDKLDHSISTSNLNECANSAPPCHKEDNLKTEDISANSHSSDLTNVIANKSSSVSPNEAPDKMNTTEELQIFELLNNFHGKPNSSDRDDTASEICESAIENPFSALKNMDSDEEIDCFGDFITIDKIDTAKSYLQTSSIVLDDYKVIDMDISPLKRKNECEEEEETTKKAKHDSLYFNINSGKLLNEINKVLKEDKQSFGISKRFRSKSLTLNDTRENSPLVRSSSMDSVDKSDVQVSYNFDLKTNLLLLLKPNPTCKETSSSVNNILKVLEDGDEKLTVDKCAPLQNESSESTSANINISNDDSTQEIKENYTDGKNFETFIEPGETESKQVTDDIKADHDLQVSTTNNSDEKGDTEENVKAVPNAQSTIKNEPCTNSKIEESNDLSTPKRKSSVDREEQSKKICLDSITENIVQPIKASYTNDITENEIAMKKEQSTDHTTSLTKSELEETNQNNVEPASLSNKTVSKESCGESLVDIEEELKSLLGEEDSLNSQQQKLRTFHKEHVENKDQKGVTSNKKIAADAVNADDKDSNKKPLKINSCNDTTCNESSSVKTSNLTQDGSNPRKPSEKETKQGTQKPNPHKQREKQIKNETSSSPVQSKPKDKLIRKQSPADKKQKSNKTHSKNGNCADVAISNVTPQPCVNKPLSHEPGEKQIASGSKTVSYYQRFKRIQSLFGSDSESEMEEESLLNAKTTHNVPDNKNSVSRKIYEESNKREIQQKQEVIGLRTNFNKQISDGPMESQKSLNLAEYYINKYIKNVPTNKPSHSLKESSKVIQKRRCSVPITDATLKFLKGAAKASNATINKPKCIEKKRRETLPASLNDGISKECKPHQGENGQVEKGVCVINHKLKDPRKEHYKYKSLEISEQKSENNSIKKYPTVKWDPKTIQNKVCEKYKNEKKNISCKTSVPKINSESKKKRVYGKSQENKSKNQKEKDCTSKKERTSDTITNQLQSKSKLSKTDQSKTIVSDPKELEASKIRKKLELTLKTGTEEPAHLQLVQCSTLPRDRFPMLQRANSRIQENDCCDKAVALENVDVNEKIDVVKQVIDQEDDVIEVREDIPIIDLTNDPVKEKPDDSLKVEVVALSHEISCKSNEMITLYRSEETVDSSLDIQPTSETVSPTALKNKRSQSNKCNTIEGFTSDKSQNSDNRKENLINASPTLYNSPLSNSTANVSSPAPLKFHLIASSNNKTQHSDRSPSSNFASPPPTMPQTMKPSEVLTDTQNVHAVRRNNFQTSVTHESGGNFVEITNQVNLTPQTSVEQRQESLVNQPTRISFSIQNNCQQNSFPPSNALAQLQQKVNSLHKTTNNSASTSQNPLLYQMINSDNVPGKNAYAIHSPMRHPEEEGPAPMHEISMQEIRSAGIVLLKYLLLYDSMKRAQWVYKNELLKIQKNMPAIIRLEIYQFECFSSQKDKKLYKDLIMELKSLNLTGRSSNVKSAEVLMEQVFNALHRKIGNLTLWRVYLMLDTVMQPEMSEYMAVPFLRDLFSYVSFVAGRIRSTLPGAPQSENTQINSPPQDPFTPNHRKMLEWQIKQYISICSIQKRLTDELQSNVSRRLPNSGMGIAQDIQQLPNYASRLNSLIIMASNQQSVNNVNPNLTVHQNIIIRPVDVTKPNGPSASNTYKNKDTCTFNDTFKIRLPYTVPYENSTQSTNASLQEQNLSHSVEAINSQANAQVSVNTQPSPITPQATIESSPTTNNCGSADPTTHATSPPQVESTVETDNVVVKQEKEAPLLTDQEIETIDLTWINDIDPKQLQSEMEFIAVKKEEPPDEEEIEVELNEEPFAVAPSPADSGISSPPIQVEYDESVFSNRSCICDKVAEYVCGCMMAMYCSVECQLEDWKSHKDICQKYKSKTNKPKQ